jgi:hypothetical protein
MADGACSRLRILGTDFAEHEQAMCNWFQSVAEGKSDGAEKVFAYLECHGVSRGAALAPLEAWTAAAHGRARRSQDQDPNE